MDDTQVSVIICAYTADRWMDIIEAIDSVRRQTRPAAQVILVIDHNPALLARAQAMFGKDVLVIPNSQARGLSGARNTGIAAATGELVAFLDDDAIAEPDWLVVAATACAEPSVLGVSTWVEPLWRAPQPAWFPDEFLWTVGCSYRGMQRATCEIRNLMGGTMILRRSVIAAVGGFNSMLGRANGTLLSCEETEMCIRARAAFPGHHFLMVPASRIHHKIPVSRLTFRYFVRRCRAEGQSKARLASIVHQRGALAVERTYVLRTLSTGILIGFRDSLSRRDLHGVQRAGAILVGLGAACLAFAAERLRDVPKFDAAPLSQRVAE